jgi:hypothetical protein
LEVVVEALRRRWQVKIVCRKSISKAYKRLQKENKELLSIQHVSPEDLEAARVKVASVSYQRLPRAPSVPRPPSPPLSAEDLRAARLKYFRQQQLVLAAEAPDGLDHDDCDGSAAMSRALCFKGECSSFPLFLVPVAHGVQD